MKTFRYALLATALLSVSPALALPQPDGSDESGRPNGPGRFERRPDAPPPARAEQPRPQVQPQPQPPRQDAGGRQDFRGRPDQVQPQPQPAAQGDPQRPQGFGRDQARGGQDGRGGGFDRRPDFADRGEGDHRFDNRPQGNQQFDDRRLDDHPQDNRQFDNRRFDNRGPGPDRRLDDNNRFRGRDDGRFDDNNRFRPDWRNDRRYDWRGYRNDNRQLFRAPRYLPPRGYGFGYRPFARGYQLDPFFYGRNYWIDDPWQYRLPPAYGSYRWVRYYNDVLLVDVYTGFVVDVIQNFFW